MSPRIWLYHLKWVPNTKETNAKISVLVTILWLKLWIVLKQVKFDPLWNIHWFGWVTTNCMLFQKAPLIKFIQLLKWSCLGHNKMNQAKNPEYRTGRVDIAVEQCGCHIGIAFCERCISEDFCLRLSIVLSTEYFRKHLVLHIYLSKSYLKQIVKKE